MVTLDALSLIAFAFSAGVFTFFAPCAYPLLPGYVSYYLGRTTAGGPQQPDGGIEAAVGHGVARAGFGRLGGPLVRAVGVSLLVSAGFFVVFGLLAGLVAALGTRFLADISVLELVVGSLLVVIGTAMAAGWKPSAPTVQLPVRRRSSWGYFGFGVLYGAAAAGCTAPIFIGVALKALSAGPAVSVLTFGSYAAGMSVLMLGVTVGTALGRGALLSWFTKRLDRIHRAAGVLLVLAGLVQIYFFLFRFGGLQMLGL